MEKKLSILLASSYPFLEEPGGVKDFILGLKTAFLKSDCKVCVIAPGSKDAQKKGLVDFVLGIDFKVATDQTEFRASFSRKETARKILEIVKPDIIVIHEPFVPSIGHTIISSLASTRNSNPIIVGQFHANREDLNWPLKAAEFIVRHSSYLSTINNNLNGKIAVSQATKRFWQKKLPANYKVIYNGIDTDRLSPHGSRIESWRKSPASSRSAGLRGARIILFAGRHDRRKGIDDLVNAFGVLVKSGIDDIKLKITGKGEMTKSLQKKVMELELQKLVEFVGVLPYSKLIKAYRSADLVVAPSAGGEGFNRTIIEARSCGTLVVCTDIEGHQEAIGKDLFPFMAKPKNPRSLAKQIMTVLNLPEAEKQGIRRRGRKDVKSNFSWDIIAKEHLNYYKSLLSKAASQGPASQGLPLRS